MKNNEWSRDQKIAFLMLWVAIIGLFFQQNSLSQKIEPVIKMEPQINNTINNITKIEKEIANINEAIIQQYGSFETELFKKSDLGKRVFAYPNPENAEKDSLLSFQLSKIPIYHSLQISNEIGFVAPSGSYYQNNNLVTVRRQGVRAENLLNKEGNVYIIKYIPNVTSNEEVIHIKGIKALIKDGELMYETIK